MGLVTANCTFALSQHAFVPMERRLRRTEMFYFLTFLASIHLRLFSRISSEAERQETESRRATPLLPSGGGHGGILSVCAPNPNVTAKWKLWLFVLNLPEGVNAPPGSLFSISIQKIATTKKDRQTPLTQVRAPTQVVHA